MPSFDLVEPPKTPRLVSGVEPWDPRSGLNYPHNIRAFAELLPTLETVNVKVEPDSGELFVVGDDNVAYDNTPERKLKLQYAALHRAYLRGLRPPYEVFGTSKIRNQARLSDEALARQLCLGIGTAALRLAIHAESPALFSGASRDAARVFNSSKTYLTTMKDFNITDSGSSLLYAYKRAAQFHKNLTQEDAAALIGGIAKVIFQGDAWYAKQGFRLERTIGYEQDAAESESAKQGVRQTPTRKELNLLLDAYPTSPHRVMVYSSTLGAHALSPFKELTKYYLLDRGIYISQEEQLAELHARHVGKGAMPFVEIAREDQQRGIFRGVQAYLRASRGDSLADDLEDALVTFDSSSLFPMLLLGNILIEKMNHNKMTEAVPRRRLPGLKDDAIGPVFAAFRDAIYGPRAASERGVVKQLGELVAAYIAQDMPVRA